MNFFRCRTYKLCAFLSAFLASFQYTNAERCARICTFFFVRLFATIRNTLWRRLRMPDLELGECFLRPEPDTPTSSAFDDAHSWAYNHGPEDSPTIVFEQMHFIFHNGSIWAEDVSHHCLDVISDMCDSWFR